jgi:hypothetical protein
MKRTALLVASVLGAAASLHAQAPATDPVKTLVGQLSLESYKATVRGLTQFGDRRQGTDRNRSATDWIEAQLKSYGCTNTERITYTYNGRLLQSDSTYKVDSAAAVAKGAPVPPRPRGLQPPAAAGDTTAQRGRGGAGAGGAAAPGAGRGRGGNPVKGFTARTGVNTNPMLQPDSAIRALDAQWDTPGERQEVFCTKIGTTHPEEMYIVGGHMDGHGFGTAANDDGSGTALVMELARIFSAPGVQTERSIRFALWNNEETGLNGAKAYVDQRKDLQGIENPKGSGKYPEPKWLGMIQHDMMLWDHGMPGPDGKLNPEQRREADVNVEFAGTSKMADVSQKLAWLFRAANDKYATDYPAAVGDRMSNTDSDAFKDLVASISLRENERLAHTGTGWNPTWHQPIDVFETFSDKDFRLGLNAAQTTLAAIAQLAGATIKP